MSQRPVVLSKIELETALQTLPRWEIADEKLHRVFRFETFVDAFGFMTRAALVAERNDHHPEWSNVYGMVQVYLVTHESGGITERDLALAKAMDALA